MSTPTLSILCCVLFVSYISAQHSTDDQLLQNPQLQWTDGQLIGWKIEKGAGNDGPKKSAVRQGKDNTLELSGDASTQQWMFVSQSFETTPGTCIGFRYTARATGVRREGNQFDNCWAGIAFTKNGQQLTRNFTPVIHQDYVPESIVVQAPPGSTHCQIAFFLSKTGTLSIRDVGAHQLKPDDSFDVLVRQMDRYYSYFEHKNMDWSRLTAKYRERAEAAATPADFEKAVLPILAELKDGHVWIQRNGQTISHYNPPDWRPNFDFSIVAKDLRDVQTFTGLGLIAKTGDGAGYIRIVSLNVDSKKMQELMNAVEQRLFEMPGMIVDLRLNNGGSEDLGLMLAGMFCKETVEYARNRFRNGVRHDEFYEFARSPIQPRDGRIYEKPVVCLIGPGAVSSGEGTALMFAALPGVTLIGQPTRGSSGNPQPVKLPNGVEVWFSRWVATSPDGTPIEDSGVVPDIVVENGPGDPTWERAKIELSSHH